MDKRKRRLLCMLEGSGRKSRWISGAPPLSFRALAAGELENYMIFGNTVGGESVGDKTGNLWDENYPDIAVNTVKYISLSVENGEYTISTNMPLSGSASLFLLSGAVISGASTNDNGVWLEHNQTVTVSDNFITIGYRIYSNADPRDYSVMLNSGSTPLPYEPYGYKVPVTVSNGTDALTTPIYLPEQIKKVGDEAEYIDYGEQKQHRVRKNLLQNTTTSRTLSTGITVTANDNKSVVINGTSSTGSASGIILGGNVVLEKGAYILSGCPQGGSNNTYKLYCIFDDDGERKVLFDIGDGATIALNGDNPKVVDNGFYIYALSCDNNVFFPMLRKADITDDTYEPYIENTDLDVTLPALPTIKGTNVLSVGTAVQPSKIDVKGKIKTI